MLLRVVMAVEGPGHQRRLTALLNHPDVIVNALKRKHLSWDRVAREKADLMIVSESLIPPPLAHSIRLLRDLPEAPEVVILREGDDTRSDADFLAAGCSAVLHAGLESERLRKTLGGVLEDRRNAAARRLTGRRMLAEPRLSDFVSYSGAMQAFMDTVRRVAMSDVSLLILGETGVGKERLAQAIHTEGPRAAGPFVAVNCGALPETLLESELFGHEEGAFTGATRARRGIFELAHRGTVFLDEIGEVPLHLQVKLLRIVQEHKVQRLGSEKTIEVDVRIMAASNRDLAAEADAKRFRRDLYYRLSVVTLTIPPLRERREDIPALVESYIGYLGHRVGRVVNAISSEAVEALSGYHWPGNVRELINVIERAMLLCNDGEIGLIDLPETIRAGRAVKPSHSTGQATPDEWLARPLHEARDEVVAAFERDYLASLLRATGGRIGLTAGRAGLQPRSLYDKMKRYGLRKEDFKTRPPAADR